MASVQNHLGVELGVNLKSISHRCHLFEVAVVWELSKKNIHLPLGCLQGGSWQGIDTRKKYEPSFSARRFKNNTGFLARPQSGGLIVCAPKFDRRVTQKQGNPRVFSSFGEDQITMQPVFLPKLTPRRAVNFRIHRCPWVTLCLKWTFSVGGFDVSKNPDWQWISSQPRNRLNLIVFLS